MQLSDLDVTKTYTYADYLKWAFDERIELIKGKIFKMSPAPGSIHQRLSQRISLKLGIYLIGKRCEVFTAPFDVRLSRKTSNDKEVNTVVQPDICVICDINKVDDRGCLGAPDIVVEILSPGNNKKELQNKYEVYEENGVLEYWIIHPSEKTFLRYSLVGNSYQASRLLTTGDEVTTPVLPGFVLNLDELFAVTNN
ncbi:Uma2 family endonuclease [Mucilaginibacter ginsenosidivorax]|uniref:Uma2 family endonuclease n=1 Tax=Mucilaginibacter ginsenosidivorax TaxID=862126 RepID=A0A5B8W2R0_9SPHI|nr:Uma2 family endonuclease [Mucilaginibacter ginsenosidivorax]QEC78013.1 Uma2 family endonuclease [Mucilaginibacter ginsenosidivorax]